MGDHIDTGATDFLHDLNSPTAKFRLHLHKKDTKIRNGLYPQYLDYNDRYQREYL